MASQAQTTRSGSSGHMMLRLLLRAIVHRPAKLISVIAALAVGATLASAFLSLYFDLPAKMSSEFRTLGPNLAITTASSTATDANASAPLIDQRILETARATAPAAEMLPWLYAVAQVEKKTMLLSGVEIDKLAAVHPGWRITPVNNTGGSKGETGAYEDAGVYAGERALARLGITPENADQQWIAVEYAGAEHHFPLRGIVSTGASTDDQLLLPLPALQRITSNAARLSAIEVVAPGDGAQVNQTLRSLESAIAPAFAGVTVQALRPVIESQARVILKVRNLMLGLTAVVLALVLLSVMVTISGLVLDRSREIGVMKALGGSNARILQFLMAEASLLALAAAVAGYFAGFALARIAAQHIFSASAESSLLSLRSDVFAAVVGITVAVALAACALPARQMKSMDPAVILRGE